jgi:hypothetical protein
MSHTAGIGSITASRRHAGRILGTQVIFTGYNSGRRAAAFFEPRGWDEAAAIGGIVATGYGRKSDICR